MAPKTKKVVKEVDISKRGLTRRASGAVVVEEALITKQQDHIDGPSIERGGSFFVPPEAVDDQDGAWGLNDCQVEDVGSDSDKEDGDVQTNTTDSAASPDTSEEDGRVWYAQLLPDGFRDPRVLSDQGVPKPQRAVPLLFASTLLDGLHKEPDGRWIFTGLLNDWPGLRNLELVSISRQRRFMRFRTKIKKRIWQSSSGKPPPDTIRKVHSVATFCSASWCKYGWSENSPGFLWWFIDRPLPVPKSPQCLFGEHLVKYLEETDADGASMATFIHLFAHRYPVAKETFADRNTWHTGLFIEWSHGRYGTVAELAFLNGCGGYGGKSNWVEDKLATLPVLYAVMADSMKVPWDEKATEIRMLDVPSKNRQEFEEYLEMYSSRATDLPVSQHRFVDPKVYASGECRLRNRRQSDIVGYFLNYVHRAKIYEKLTTNCQTFTADAFAFLAGARDVQPFGAIIKPGYKQRSHSFLYAPKPR